jgi:putative PIN family toxin of toxin-antitoxin system
VRAVIDTNVLLFGLLWHGTPHRLIEQARAGMVILVSSPAMLAELAEVIARPKFTAIIARSDTNPQQILAEVRRLVGLAEPPPLPAAASRDPDDAIVLALAVAARAERSAEAVHRSNSACGAVPIARVGAGVPRAVDASF